MISHVIWDLGETLTTPPHGKIDKKPLTAYPEIQLRAHVPEVLETIQQMGLKQSILSNTATSDSDVVRELLDSLHILDKLEYVYATKSELEPDIPEKPDRIVFDHVLEKLDMEAEEAVMIGNTWDTDIVGANNIGMHAIWLQNPEVSVRKDVAQSACIPPWILPVWDVESVPKAVELIMECSQRGDKE